MPAKPLFDGVVVVETQRCKKLSPDFDPEQNQLLDWVGVQACPSANYSFNSIESIAQQQRVRVPYYLQK